MAKDCRTTDDRAASCANFCRTTSNGAPTSTPAAYYYVKSPVFPWNKFPGVDTVLGPEMKSTGEVMGVADNFGEAFAKAQVAAGQKLPTQGAVFISVTDHDKRARRSCSTQVRRHGLQVGRDRRHSRRHRGRRHERGARLQSEGGPSERCRLHQGRAYSAHRQHAAPDKSRGSTKRPFGAPPYWLEFRRLRPWRRRGPPPKASPPCSAEK